MATRHVLLIATLKAGTSPDSHEAWMDAVRARFPKPDAATPLNLEFALVTKISQIEAKLASKPWSIVHSYEHDRGLLDEPSKPGKEPPNQLQIINRFYAKPAERRTDEADDSELSYRPPADCPAPPACVLLTETSSKSGIRTGAVPGVPVTVRMSGRLDDTDGPALAFADGFYGALAAGLSLPTAVSEGRVSAAGSSSLAPFEVTMFEGSTPALVRTQPFEQLRELKETARSLAESIRAVQSQLGHSSRLSSGDLLGERYVLDEQLTSGCYTEIWRAYDRDTRRVVTVKVLHEAWARDPRRLARYERSALAMSELRHEHIATIVARAQLDRQGRNFYVMRWYEGGDLAHAVREGMDTAKALSVCADAFEGLAEAHKRGLLHRDLRPEHILIDAEGRGALADFDLELSDNHVTTLRGVPPPPYAAPELHPIVDTRADLYSAAMIVVFVFTGHDPDPREPLAKLDEAGGCSELLRGHLANALASEPAKRTITAAELALHLREYVATPEPERARRVSGWSERGRDIFGRWSTFRIGQLEHRMRWIEPGKFSMGARGAADMSQVDPGWRRCEPVHTVMLSRGFWLAETECTQALWRAVMDSNPSKHLHDDNPVEMVSWVQVHRFLVKLNELVGGPAFCLPTEAQWEYACRADSSNARRLLGEIAWYSDNTRDHPMPVRLKLANPWGLHDTLGNVWEWCDDGPRVYGPDAVVDPVGPLDRSEMRVIRGGGFLSSKHFGVRAADRFAVAKQTTDLRVGFRIARMPD